MSSRTLGRRQFLGSLGALGLLPFVPVLNASGAEPVAPKRLVLIYTPHGTIRDRWLPSGSGSNFGLSEILAPFAPYKSKMAVVDGLSIRADESIGAPHTKGMPLLWTGSGLLEDDTFERLDQDGNFLFNYGWNEGASVDQLIATHLEATGSATPYRSLQFGVQCSNSHPGHRMVYSGAQKPLQPVNSPYQALDQYFGVGSTPHELATRKAERLSILDAVFPQVQALSSKVSSEDKFKIEAHLDAINDIEYSLKNTVVCTAPEVQSGLHQSNSDDVPLLTQAQMKIMARVLACDMTRVCSFQFSRGENDSTKYPWLGVNDQVHHLITHDQSALAIDQMTSIYTWYAQQVADFIGLLDSIPEGDGTLLDNTLVVWGSEISRGWDHNFDNMPFVLAGGGGGAIPMGRFYQFPGQEHNRLLVSLCQAMGMASTNQFGTLDLGNGALDFG